MRLLKHSRRASKETPGLLLRCPPWHHRFSAVISVVEEKKKLKVETVVVFDSIGDSIQRHHGVLGVSPITQSLWCTIAMPTAHRSRRLFSCERL
jgi:hypothetical protein